MPTRRSPSAAKPAPVVFPANGTPPDEHGYPHYQRMGAANVAFKRAYLKELAERRETRAKLYRGRGRSAQWTRRVAKLRSELAQCLGLAFARSTIPAPPRFLRAYPLFSKTPEPGTPAWAADIRAFYYEVPDAAWDGGAVELLLLKSTVRRDPTLPPVLLLPDTGAVLFGAQSPETAARAWGLELAAAGFVVGIPKLPGLEQFSGTQNKRRILEGACTLGEVIGEAARVLDALLQLSPDKAPRAWVAGSGVGATAALLLGALEARAAGVVCDAPLAVGSGSDVDALMIPRFNRTTDVQELVASLAPRPIAFVKPEASAAKLAADVARLNRAAKSASNVFRSGQQAAVIAWLKGRKFDRAKLRDKNMVVRGPHPERKFAIANVADAQTWKQQARRLRRAYREQAGMPAESKPLDVKFIGRAQLPNYTREEFHVRTGQFTWSNLIFLRPHGPERRRTTILHLPGSGSDVAVVERKFAHELVAQDWNACIIDARVALYPWLPNVPEGMAMINQSLHDLCCCLDYVAARPDVDAERIGCMGVSQGGTHTWMLAAMDDRIAAAAPICGACTYRCLSQEWRTEWYDGALLSFLDSGTIYYTTPGVLHLADQQDLCGLIAPRPFALIGANHDNCFPLSGMRECDRDLRRLYRLYGKEDHYLYYEFEGPHSMPEHSRRAAYAFFKKHLR